MQQLNQLLTQPITNAEKNGLQILKSNAPISEFVQQQADQYGFIAKVSEFCKTPQKLTLFINSDMQGLEIPQTALIDMFINIDGGGAAAKAAYVKSKIDAGTQPQDAAESLILVMAGVIKTAANKSYQIKEADSHEAAIECARSWFYEPEWQELVKEDIIAAFRLAAYGGEIKAYNALTYQFFCEVVKNYLKARKLVKTILKAIKQDSEKTQPLQLNSGENVKNEEAALGWWREFRDDVMNKTAKMPLMAQRKFILQKLSAAGIMQITPELKSQIYKDALLQIINEKIGERMSGAATSYERAKNRNCVLLLMDEFRKSYSDSLQMQTVFDICSKIAANNEALQVAIKDMAGTDKQTADEANTAQLAITKLNLWYEHAVKNLDFNQLPQSIE
jgi:hypothetical protein